MLFYSPLARRVRHNVVSLAVRDAALVPFADTLTVVIRHRNRQQQRQKISLTYSYMGM
jgi:Ethanolamine utilization protein EutJ (predicted chaperonin)